MGEYWPMITPCFEVRAVDEAGDEHAVILGEWHGSPGSEGSGSFWFWPPAPASTRQLKVSVSTLWEATWAELPVPR